jgi:sulfur carrier protein
MPAKGTRRGRLASRQAAPSPGAAAFAMRVLVNGQPVDLREGITLEDLLRELGVRREFTAVALNREVTARSRYATTQLQEGDRIEIVRPMAGGV